MPTTRSASKKQASLEDVGVNHNTDLASKSTSSSRATKSKRSSESESSTTATKRKSTTNQQTRPAKKSKSTSSTVSNTTKEAKNARNRDSDNEHGSIVINRAPVLQLWAAVVAAFTHPDEAWETCLSVGGAISTLCAISKGRAIGKIEPKDKSGEEHQDGKSQQQGQRGTRKLDVMGFDLEIKDDHNGSSVVMLGDKPKPVKEALLQGKFGGEEPYANVRRVMQEALRSWSDDRDGLDGRAFRMYERFRPEVSRGQSGWGRRGELKLDVLTKVIEGEK